MVCNMKTLQEELGKLKPVSKANNERASMVEYFVLPLIEERRAENFRRFKLYRASHPNKTVEDFKKTKNYLKPLTAKGIAVMLAKVETEELFPFFKRCVAYKGGFSRAFFGSLKKK